MRFLLIGGLILIFSSSHSFAEGRWQRCKVYLALLGSFVAGMAVAESMSDDPDPIPLDDNRQVVSAPEHPDKEHKDQ